MRKKNKPLYSKTLQLQIYDDGIKPSRIGLLNFDFIPFDKLIGIYEVDNWRSHYIVQYKHDKRSYKNRGLDGNIFTLTLSRYDFDDMISVLRERVGDEIDKIYKPERTINIKDGIFEINFQSKKSKAGKKWKGNL